ncbi:RecQ family ATP-dependent DNA helicase [Alkalihalobacillus sp. 1P02AB]|uniref:RecQ family ATP-dependent DNA helicase n=1 Tax=Alkalihalobacillus sp. 1P02AB TaxID=3132260 RepID=UPI0039A40392
MNLVDSLKKWFGYDSFRPGQKEIIETVLSKQDVIAMLPTGAGKSICYQLPALLNKGTTIIVSPLLSLMEDQVQQLKKNGIKKVVAINSFLSFAEKKHLIEHLPDYKMIYLAPEMLRNKAIMNQLKQMKIDLFVIDEAHCISQWGHDFRPDYIRLQDVRKALHYPPTLAITATATMEIRNDIKQLLALTDVTEHIHSVERANIAFRVEKFLHTDDKLKRLLELVERLEGPGMIYFSSRLWTEKVSYLLKQQHQKVSHYHGGMSNEERLLIQQQFLNGQLSLICCTSAFGMGINKKDIRYIIHFHYPTELESYLQEIGRAGRDGKASIAYLLASSEDHQLANNLITLEQLHPEQIEGIIKSIAKLETLSQEHWLSILAAYECSETSGKILLYHFETYRFLIEGKVQKMSLNSLKEEIVRIFDSRQNVRKNKLNTFERWINTQNCRRKEMLAFFDEFQQKNIDYCCDRCGFEQEHYFFKEQPQSQEESFKWETELAQKLLQVGL